MDYGNLSDEELEAHLNPRVAVPDFQAHIDDYVARSAASRARLSAEIDVPYGRGALETLDIFPSAKPDAPVQVFIHGGYWRALDKADHSFAAEALVEAGATVVMPNYDLCPSVDLDRIVEQVRAAVAWTYRHASGFGGDPDRLFISGHSAGAHLAIMALSADRDQGLPPTAIKGVTAISGLYDLKPVLRISVNEDVRLTAEMAERNSPTLHPPARGLPMMIAVGADEPAGWIKQSTDFRDAYNRVCGPCDYLEVAGRSHFSILHDVADRDSALCQAMLRQMSLA